jgi:hypothetical protein
VLTNVLGVLARVFAAGVAFTLTILVGSPSADPAATMWILGVGTGAALMTAVLGWWYLDRVRQRGRAQTHQDRIREVKEHLTRTGELLSALNDDLATRTALLEKAEADADRYEKLASLNAEQAKAVEDLVGRQFKRQGRANAIYWWAAIVVAFISGIVVNAITPIVLAGSRSTTASRLPAARLPRATVVRREKLLGVRFGLELRLAGNGWTGRSRSA